MMSGYHMCAWWPWRPQEVLDSLELELQTIVSSHGATLPKYSKFVQNSLFF